MCGAFLYLLYYKKQDKTKKDLLPDTYVFEIYCKKSKDWAERV